MIEPGDVDRVDCWVERSSAFDCGVEQFACRNFASGDEFGLTDGVDELCLFCQV